LDKDGTLLEDVPFNADPQTMRLTRGAAAGLRLLGQLKIPLIVVTNQPGVALGRIPIDAMADIAERLKAMFAAAGARLAAFHYCPHHPEGSDARYAIACPCRKPAPGLIQCAAAELGIDLSRSWMIGDILDDVEAGCRVGCRTILIDNGNETLWRSSPLRNPDYRVSDLLEAAVVVKECALRATPSTRLERACR
jgi:histidinol-phosphate phosphatase family protein